MGWTSFGDASKWRWRLSFWNKIRISVFYINFDDFQVKLF